MQTSTDTQQSFEQVRRDALCEFNLDRTLIG
jgi:hypothetical protein